MKRKLLPVFLALCMTLTLVPGAFAADPEDNYGVTPAILHDPTDGVADKYLYDPGSYRVDVTKAEAGAEYDYNVAIHAKNLKPHANASNYIAHWCGFAVAAPESTVDGGTPAKMKFATGHTLKDLKTAWSAASVCDLQENVADGKPGFVAYLNGDSGIRNEYYQLQWADASGNLLGSPTIYQTDIWNVKKYTDDVYIDIGNGEYKRTMMPAILSNVDGTPAGGLCSDYFADGTWSANWNLYGGTFTYALLVATDLVKHVNAAGEEGYWIGFAITAPKGAKTMRYDSTAEYSALSLGEAVPLQQNINQYGNSGIMFYTDAGAASAELWCKVQWLDKDGLAILTTVYNIDLEHTSLSPDETVFCPLSFDANGGTAVTGAVKEKGSTVDLSDYTTTREGYTFAGWYADEALTVPVTSVTLDASKTVYAKWRESIPEQPAPSFSDVGESDWFYDAVQYVYANDMMNGVSENSFAPNNTTDRAMLVTILYRLENEPAASGSSFADVPSGQWYTDAVAWAAANGIVNGVTDTTFAPNCPITREQMAAILYRYAAWKGCDVSGQVDLSGYTDADSVSTYAKEALAWANAEGLITGVTGTTLRPAGSAVRAQAATILMRLCENVLA